jgi:GTPase SAR1 family protein
VSGAFAVDDKCGHLVKKTVCGLLSQNWVGQIKQHAMPDVNFMIVGNKTDLAEERVCNAQMCF